MQAPQAFAPRADMSFLKDGWRRRTLACLRRAAGLWKRGKLDRSYLELFGRSGFAMYDVLKPLLPHRGGWTDHYIGIDNRPDILLHALLDRVPNFPLYFGDAFVDVPLLLRGGARIGAVMLDTTNAVRRGWWDDKRESLRDIATLGMRASPTFLLMLNHTLTRGHDEDTTLEGRIAEHAESLAATFGRSGLERGSLVSGLAAGLAALPLDRGGWTEAGAFDIYRSEDHSLYMITVRIVFDARTGRAHAHRFNKSG